MAETVEAPSGKEEEGTDGGDKKVEASPIKDGSEQQLAKDCSKDGEDTKHETSTNGGEPEQEKEETEPEQEKEPKYEQEKEEPKPKLEESGEKDGDTEEVVTLEDDGGDAVPSVTVPDVVFFDNVSEEEKKFFEDNMISADKVEDMKVQCTACFKQVGDIRIIISLVIF